jgi:chemotaxis protein MotB
MSKKKKHASHEEEGGEAWLLPYSDLMTLLLAVFIVLFAVSQVDEQKAQAMSDEFSEQMMTGSYTAAKMSIQENTQQQTSSGAISEQQQMEKLKAELDAKLKSENLSDSVKTGIDKRGLVISLSNAIFFDPGSAEIKLDNEKTLLEIADMVNVMDNFIRIEGHTDDVPMNSDLYRSNWDLSAARAANVVRLLTSKSSISPDRLIAVGYGEYRPVADNTSDEGRAKNRRIDIIVLSEKYDDLEQ